MKKFKLVTESTLLQMEDLIREFDSKKEDYVYYRIGAIDNVKKTYEVVPEDVGDLKKHGVQFYYTLEKMIIRKCEYFG